jgi:hypothetical protein
MKALLAYLLIGVNCKGVCAEFGRFGEPVLKTWGALSVPSLNPQYPRPLMVRPRWMDIDGAWDFQITRMGPLENEILTSRITVPFSNEALLSDRFRRINEHERLWYHRSFTLPTEWLGYRILLHFGAVNWEARISLNGIELGKHRGGYDAFSFDITDSLKSEGAQELLISVLNPIDSGDQPRGKEMLCPHLPYFGASSGIWQVVWLEPVPNSHIQSINLSPDIDHGCLKVKVSSQGTMTGVSLEAIALDAGTEVGRAVWGLGAVSKTLNLDGMQVEDSNYVGEASFTVNIPTAKLWSPDSPFLYDLKLTLLRDGKVVDSVSSYFGMRKISVAKDESGFPRLLLNNRRVFQLGPLDQGYWPGGLYTVPSDDALRYDIETMKRLGFNMVRKHVKIEPERWYYWCDKLGLLVWQDMPNGGQPATPQNREIRRNEESARQFEAELKQMVVQRGNHPSVVTWIAFNQGWGQYDTARITSLIKRLDPSRLVIDASGWFDMGVGDILSLHAYPGPPNPVHDGWRPWVCGECGGLGFVVPRHTSGAKGQWNVTYYESTEKLMNAYAALMLKIQRMEERDGLSAAVITQLTDIESELDGFMTYDRAVIKMPVDQVREINERVIHAEVMSAVSQNQPVRVE